KNKYNNMLKKINRKKIHKKKTIKKQDKSKKNIEKMSKSLEKVETRVTDLEYETKSHEKEIENLQGTVEAEAKGNREVIGYWLGFAGVVLVPLISLVANIFFK